MLPVWDKRAMTKKRSYACTVLEGGLAACRECRGGLHHMCALLKKRWSIAGLVVVDVDVQGPKLYLVCRD